jgi:hypothetical protein
MSDKRKTSVEKPQALVEISSQPSQSQVKKFSFPTFSNIRKLTSQDDDRVRQERIASDEESVRDSFERLKSSKFIEGASTASGDLSFNTQSCMPIQWYKTHSKKVWITLVPSDIHTPSKDLLPRQFSLVHDLTECIHKAMHSSSNFQDWFSFKKAILSPVMVHINEQNMNDITAIFCPPYQIEVPNLLDNIKTLEASFPITYRPGISVKKPGFFTISFSEFNPLDDVTILSLSFQISFDSKAVRQDFGLASDIIVSYFQSQLDIDLSSSQFSISLPPPRADPSAKDKGVKVTPAKLLIDYNALELESLKSLVLKIGLIHGIITMIPDEISKHHNFSFKVYCKLFDHRVEVERPIWSKAIIDTLHLKKQAKVVENLDSTLRLLFGHHHIDEKGEDINGIRARLKLDKEFEAQITEEKIASILSTMIDQQLIQRSPLNRHLYMIAPYRRRWTSLKIKCMDGSFLKYGSQKDLGSYLTSVFGNPPDDKHIENASFYVSTACSIIALSQYNKEDADIFTAYDFFIYITQRFTEYNSALSSEHLRNKLETLPIKDLVHEGQATSSLWLQFVSDIFMSPDNLIFTNPAAIACFLFPPKFKQFNWMFIQLRDIASQLDEEVCASIEKIFLVKASASDAKTIFIRVSRTGGRPPSFLQLNFQAAKIESIISTILSTTKAENKFVISFTLPQGFPNIPGLSIPKLVYESTIIPHAKQSLKRSQWEGDLKKWLHTKDYTEGLSKAQMEEAFCQAHPNCQPPQIQACIQQLIDNGFIYQSNSVDTEIFLVSPKARLWKDVRLRLDGQTFHTQFKDLGIWLDKATGHDATPLPYKCFCLHVAHAYTSITKQIISAAQLDQYMQFRFQQFKIALDFLEEQPHHWTSLSNHHQQCMEHCSDSIIDPDSFANSAFWSHPEILSEFAVSYGKAVNTSMWAFMLLPTEFHKFNYLIINISTYQDPTGTKSFQLSGPSHYFTSPDENAKTIVLAYQGGTDGHFFLLKLHSSKEDEIIQLAIQANSSFRIRLNKQEEHFWAPISAACRDFSIQSFIDRKPENYSFNFENHVHHNEKLPTPEAHLDEELLVADSRQGSPAQQDSLSASQKRKRTNLRKAIAKTSSEISALCDQADELSLIVPEDLPITKLNKYIDELYEIISNVQSLIAKAASISSQMAEDQRTELTHFFKPQERLPPIIEMRNKFVKVKEAQSKSKKTPKQPALTVESKAAPEKTALDFMFKVKSVFPSEDVSDQMSGVSLLSLFIIIPIPHSTVTLYHSIIEASCNVNIIDEMETIFKRKLHSSKELACEIHQLTRNQFSQVQDCPMVRGGRTFNEYLTYKNAQSWEEIANDHILGEVSLCSQIWKLNIAVIWRHENVWRLFISINGGSSPILSLLYAKTKYVATSEGFPQFCASTASRFFPLLPTNDDWFVDEVFVASIPDSLPEEEEHAEIALFNKRVDRESLFAAVVHTEGTISSDETSIITADHASELLMDSFVDNESVSQGSLPTPPEIRAIPLRKQCETVYCGRFHASSSNNSDKTTTHR